MRVSEWGTAPQKLSNEGFNLGRKLRLQLVQPRIQTSRVAQWREFIQIVEVNFGETW